jgi:hypothetical protein
MIPSELVAQLNSKYPEWPTEFETLEEALACLMDIDVTDPDYDPDVYRELEFNRRG